MTGAEITACGNIIRGLKRGNYLILETQAQGNINWLPYPGQLRLCAYSHLANGANSIMYWHWSSIHNAIESYWKGVLSHNFSENATYREAVSLGNELAKIGSHLINLQKKNSVAILVDNESLTGLTQFPTGSLGSTSYNTVYRWLSDSLHRANIECDVIFTKNMNLSNYRAVFVPSLYSASEDTLRGLEQYTADGGTLVVAFRSGFSDEHLKIYHDTQPHLLHSCLGISYDQFTVPKNVSLDCEFAPSHKDAVIKEWMELITPDTAQTLARYHHPVWREYSAITENHYGKGYAFYLGCLFDDATLDLLLPHLLDRAGVVVPQTRFPIITKRGKNDFGKEILYYLNYSPRPQSLTYEGAGGTLLLSGTTISKGATLCLAPWGVEIVEE